MKRTHKGSCHCGAVRYEADLDLSRGTFKCNCSVCAKTRAWLAVVQPEDFRLLAGESELTEYLFNRKSIHHLFCRRCGVRSFAWGDAPENGRFYVVHVACLDNVGDDELVSAPITYVDGRNDRWQTPPTETGHL